MIIGLTGGIASGKSTSLKLFEELGAAILSSDEITRQLMEKGKDPYYKIIAHFDKEILNKDQSLDRSKLRKIIFDSPREKEWLETLLHPAVKAEILAFSQTINPGQYLVVEIPLLIEADFFDAVDRVLVIDCDEDLQLKRVKERDDNSTLATLKAILKTQVDRETRLKNADDIIQNEGSLNDLKEKVKELHQYYVSTIFY